MRIRNEEMRRFLRIYLGDPRNIENEILKRIRNSTESDTYAATLGNTFDDSFVQRLLAEKNSQQNYIPPAKL